MKVQEPYRLWAVVSLLLEPRNPPALAVGSSQCHQRHHDRGRGRAGHHATIWRLRQRRRAFCPHQAADLLDDGDQLVSTGGLPVHLLRSRRPELRHFVRLWDSCGGSPCDDDDHNHRAANHDHVVYDDHNHRAANHDHVVYDDHNHRAANHDHVVYDDHNHRAANHDHYDD